MKKLFFTISLMFAQQFILEAQTHFVGENFGGGIVFSVSSDSLHGLIVETINQSQSACSWDDALLAIKETTNYSEEGKKHNDWRLPTIEELNLLHKNLKLKDLCSTVSTLCLLGDYYWSSSNYTYIDPDTGEESYDYAWYFMFSSGTEDWTATGNANSVRTIREF